MTREDLFLPVLHSFENNNVFTGSYGMLRFKVTPQITMKTPKELSLLIAANVRKRRKGQKLSMQDLSDKSGVSYGSIKRFESIGEISLTSLLKIAVVLDCADGFEQLFAETEIRSIQEIIDGKV